ncbi:MAG: hypothetical protein ACYS9X_07525 [Planctomycetota bacterium]
MIRSVLGLDCAGDLSRKAEWLKPHRRTWGRLALPVGAKLLVALVQEFVT